MKRMRNRPPPLIVPHPNVKCVCGHRAVWHHFCGDVNHREGRCMKCPMMMLLPDRCTKFRPARALAKAKAQRKLHVVR